jgi:hypothetical protein
MAASGDRHRQQPATLRLVTNQSLPGELIAQMTRPFLPHYEVGEEGEWVK